MRIKMNLIHFIIRL
uniref:Uncharacterized protein n=1 Tax=Anguilla anguilla TaxID=7936 RepID=A0A0E9V3P3_ANGAN